MDLRLLSSSSGLKFVSEQQSKVGDDEDEDSGCNDPAKPHTKRTRGKQKIPIQFIGDRIRRCSTFSKRKTGLMKKANELAQLTGADVLLIVASETSHVYTYTTKRLKALVESEPSLKLIEGCLRQQTPSTSSSVPSVAPKSLSNDAKSPAPCPPRVQQTVETVSLASSSSSTSDVTLPPILSQRLPPIPILPSTTSVPVSQAADTSGLYLVQEPPIFSIPGQECVSTAGNPFLSLPFTSIFPTVLQLPGDGSGSGCDSWGTCRPDGPRNVSFPIQFTTPSSHNNHPTTSGLEASEVSPQTALCLSLRDQKKHSPT